jgi:hypothetical protein
MIDYTMGYWVKVFPKKAFKSVVWIFDRYYYDYLIDPKRARIKLPNWVFKVGLYLIPEPDLIICLGADSTVIHNRKPELSLDEVERQVMELTEFCHKHKRAVWVDTDSSIEQSVQNTMFAISKMMEKRFETMNKDSN